MTLAHHQQHAAHHLHGTNQGDDRHHHADRHMAIVEQWNQVEAHGREGKAITGEGHDQAPESRHPHGRGERALLLRARGVWLDLGDRHGLLVRAGDEQPVDQEAHAKVDRRHHFERWPPADALDQELRERNAEGAGEAAEEGHQQDRLSVSRPVDPGDHGEGRLVEDDGLAGAEPDPQRVKHRQRTDPRPYDEECRGQQRAACHQHAAVPAIDPGADRDRAQAGDQQAG